MSTAVFDVETQYITESPYDAILTSLSIIWSDDGVSRFYSGDDETIKEGLDTLLLAKRICGFNSHRFDVPVILKYFTREEGRKLRSKPHLDFYHEYTQQKRGQRISLDNVSRSTLGIWDKKFELYDNSATSLWRVNPAKLKEYNDWDTRVTYRILQYLYTYGYIWYTAPTRQKLHIPDWAPILWNE